MRYGRDYGRIRREGWREDGEWLGRGEYGVAYEAPYRAGFHGYGMGYAGGSLRSRGSYEAGQLRSGLNPVDEFEFEWGDGYIGGRGYGGTNYDLEHGYRTAAPQGRERVGTEPPTRSRTRRAGRPPAPSPTGTAAYDPAAGVPHGPARYGYGPYHERLRRVRRSDDEIRHDVEEAIFYDTWVDADRITVEVEDGVVTLRGRLPSYDEVRYATDDAWDVDGVRGVRTELTVDERAARAGPKPARGPGAAGRREASGEIGASPATTETAESTSAAGPAATAGAPGTGGAPGAAGAAGVASEAAEDAGSRDAAGGAAGESGRRAARPTGTTRASRAGRKGRRAAGDGVGAPSAGPAATASEAEPAREPEPGREPERDRDPESRGEAFDD